MTTIYMRLSITLILTANLASCVPFPHVAYLRPTVTGTIVEDGKTISGVQLYLAKFAGTNHPCTEVGEIVPLTADGAFSFASVQQHNLTDSLINPVSSRGKLTVLCMRHPTKGELIGITMLMKQDKPVSLRIVCDLARPHRGSVGPHTASSMVGQPQHCKSSTSH